MTGTRSVTRDPLAGAVVIQFADFGSPYSGNFLASLHALEQSLGQCGARQILVLPERALPRPWLAELLAAGAMVYILPETSSFPRTVLRIWRILGREAATVAHVHFSRNDVHVWLAAALHRVLGPRVTVVWHDHGGTLPPARTIHRRIKDIIKLRWMGRSAWVMCVSPVLRADLLVRGLPGRRAQVVLNGIDLERARQVQTPRAQLRGELGLPDTARVFLAFGWDPYRKGIDLALAAMRELADAHPEALLLLVGTPATERFARDRVGDQLPGWLRLAAPRESVADFYQAADVFLATSREEGMPYSLAEAMVNSLPVVASDIGGHAMFADAGGVTGFTSGSVPGLIGAMRSILTQPRSAMMEWGAANRAFVENHFSLRSWTRAVIACYREWLRRDRGPR